METYGHSQQRDQSAEQSSIVETGGGEVVERPTKTTSFVTLVRATSSLEEGDLDFGTSGQRAHS